MHGLSDRWAEMGAALVASALASWGLGFVVRRWLTRMQIIDLPNERSSHVLPTPRGGGVGIMAVIGLGIAVLLVRSGGAAIWAMAIATLALVAVSFLDDRHTVSWRIRLGVQALAAAVAVAGIVVSSYREDWRMAAAAFPFLVFIGVGYANVFNFMDGINGLAAGQAALTGLGTALVGLAAGAAPGHPVTVISLLVAGSAAGFLPHNFPRARMFMGDVSSVPLGFLLALLAAWIACERGFWLLVPLGLLHANFILDSGLTLVRRMARRDVLHQAHREHFYQRLVRAGWSHTTVTGIECGLQAVVVLGAVAAVGRGLLLQALAAGLTLALWFSFFGFCEREFRRNG